ncbi:MAG: hypothetical protein JW894_11145 [Bacteroidales bacterium]|nr:hypothetical protein [Bacteroidales bacterium]
MKNFRTLLLIFFAFTFPAPAAINAQDKEESLTSIDTGLDIYSSYVWRGSKFGSGPAFQPWVEGGIGALAIGAWGSVNSSTDESFEMDLYISYGFDFGLSIAVTDYYFGGDYTITHLNHYIEPSLVFEIGDLSLTAAYMFLAATEADEEAGTEATDYGEEGDMYFEAGYAFGALEVAIGAGDGQYVSEDDDFMICNLTVGTSKEIEITDRFFLPLSGAVTFNPSTGGFFIYAGISF